MFAAWPCPLAQGGTATEVALAFDQDRARRLLIVPALFDEANRMRRLTADIMRRLDGAGIDSFFPDLPGCGESLQPLEVQTPKQWRMAMQAAAAHFCATHVLAIRGGALVMPEGLPGWRYAPVTGERIVRQLVRSRIVAARELGLAESQGALLASATEQGVELAGYRIGAKFVIELQGLEPGLSHQLSDISQDMVGGAGLWLRSEPSDDRTQADALAAIIAVGLSA